MTAGSDSSLSIRMGPPISEKAPFAGAFFSALDKMFQEQVMKLAMIAAGYTPGEAD
jgi:Bacterial DNA polymerase III alpha subunit finger domain